MLFRYIACKSEQDRDFLLKLLQELTDCHPLSNESKTGDPEDIEKIDIEHTKNNIFMIQIKQSSEEEINRKITGIITVNWHRINHNDVYYPEDDTKIS